MRDTISTMEDIQYCQGIQLVLSRDTINTVEGYHPSVLQRDTIIAVEIPSVLWRIFSAVGDTISTVDDI